MSRFLVALGSVALIATSAACSDRTVDYKEDFTTEVDRICADYCNVLLACYEPTSFESYEECDGSCLGAAYIYNDTDCGAAYRAVLECVGSQPTCELFLDTYDVHADDYTCKAEKDRYASLVCGLSDEDPYEGAP